MTFYSLKDTFYYTFFKIKIITERHSSYFHQTINPHFQSSHTSSLQFQCTRLQKYSALAFWYKTFLWEGNKFFLWRYCPCLRINIYFPLPFKKNEMQTDLQLLSAQVLWCASFIQTDQLLKRRPWPHQLSDLQAWSNTKNSREKKKKRRWWI